MSKYTCLLVILGLIPATAVSQSVIRARNPVVNAASYRTPGLPGSGIAQGAMFTIFGTGLGPDNFVQAQTYPLPKELGGTSVTVRIGETSTPALVILSYRTQINAILPSTVPIGSGTVTVTYDGHTSDPAPIEVVTSAFGMFTYNSSGSGQAIATDPQYAYNTIVHTFHPGDYAILWGTGLGPITAPDENAPPAGDLPGEIQVMVGNSAAPVAYHGRASCCSGLDQIVIQIPPGIQGCYVPIAVKVGGAMSNITTVAVSASGSTCSDSIMGQDLVDRLAAGQTVRFGLVRLESLIAPVNFSGYASVDIGYATFSEYTPQTAGYAEYGVSSGYCVAVDCSYGCGVRGGNGSLLDSSPAQLNAGTTLAVEGQGRVITMPGSRGYYGALLNTTSRFLWSGFNYTVSGTGGSQVGGFSAVKQSGLANTQFSNIKATQAIPLSSDLTVQWTGGDPKVQKGQVTIGAYSGNDDLSKWVWLQCTAPLAAGKFTIPGWILSTLPPTGTGYQGSFAYPQGWIWIGQYSNPVPFTAEHMDWGVMTDAFFNGYAVYFQ